jgi:hypothetical protein
LREFGLFGGDATGANDSGYLINYVIHPRLDVAAGNTLARRVRLTFSSPRFEEWLVVPDHPFAGHPVTHLDGVGPENGALLRAVGVETIGDLARREPQSLGASISRTTWIELRAKARRLLHTAANFTYYPQLAGLTVEDFFAASPEDLADHTGLPIKIVRVVFEQLCLLQVTLDSRFLKQLQLGELVGD